MPGAADLEITGRTLGEFLIREELGSGAMGAVFRAEQTLLGRDAVVKVLNDKTRGNEDAVRRFLREARLASKLDHPYAAHIYAFGAEPDGLLWIAMELVRGTPLNTYLTERERLPLNRVLPLLERICEVVQAAHDAGMVHRDLKPANVMVLSRAGRLLPKLLDFGIAKLNEDAVPVPVADPEAASAGPQEEVPGPDLTATGGGLEKTGFSRTQEALDRAMTMDLTTHETQLGSPAYMAPEQWLNAARVDGRADLYSLGVMTYQLLSGKLPFNAKTLPKLMAQHARGVIPPLPPELGLPKALDEVIARALAKKPGDRFATAVELSTALRQASGLGDEPAVLPQLPEFIRDTVLATAPQPLAESVAGVEAARSPRAAIEALAGVARTVVRILGVMCLAARAHLGPGREGDSPELVELLTLLRRGMLTDSQWAELGQRFARQFSLRRASFPIPELLDFLNPVEPAAREENRALLQALGDSTEPLPALMEAEAQLLLHRQRLELITRALRALTFLDDYPLVRFEAGTAERWMGGRRAKRAAMLVSEPLADGELALLDAEGQVLLRLSPLVQAMAPSPGAPEELFFLEGDGRFGAKLMALPVGYERHDETLWGWLAEHVLPAQLGDAGPVRDEKTPFRGLASFTPDDAENYFGREREAEAFANRLRMQSMLAVVGPSGVGKSSFIQAGVLPRLAGVWRSLTVRPGPAPLAALAATLEEAGLGAPNLKAELSVRPAVLGERLRLGAQNGPGLLLIVDQFEELITLCADPQERKQYAEALVAAARSVHEPVRVVLTLRDDFLIRVQQISALRERLAPGLQLLATPALEDLQRILAEPIRRLGYSYDDDALPRLMAEQVAQQPGALALLSFTATKLWELRDRRLKRLTRKAYEALGGVGGALAHHAEETLSALSEPEQKLVRETFRHLVSAEGTRAILTRSELRELLGPQGLTVVEKLIHARLLTASESATGEDRVEVIHEALLISWPRLVKWQREDAENARLRDQLRAAARQWEERKRSKGVLWRGEALMEYRLWRGRYPGAVTASEDAFARASLAEDQRGRQLRRGLLAGLFVLLCAGMVVLYRAQLRAQKSSAAAQAALARLHAEQGRLSSLAGKPLDALVYLSQASTEGVHDTATSYLLARSMESARAEKARLLGHAAKLYDAELSPDGTRAVTASADRTSRIWDVKAQRVLFTLPHRASVYGAHFSADGSHILTASQDGTAQLWSALDGKPLFTFKHKSGEVLDARLSPGGLWVATSGEDGTVRVWNARTGDAVLSLQASRGELAALRFSSNGRRLAAAAGFFAAETSADASVSLIDVHTGLLRHLPHPAPVIDLAFSPDGRRLVTVSADTLGRVFDVESGELLHTLEGHLSIARAVAWSPDGARIATSGDDKLVLLWDAKTYRRLGSLAGHDASVRTLDFSPDSRRLVSGGNDGRAALWDVRTLQLVNVFVGHTDSVWSARFSGTGGEVLTAGRDFSARLWDATAQRQVLSLPAEEGGATGQYLRTGTTLGFAASQGRISFLDPAGRPLASHVFPDANMSNASFSGDGSFVIGTSVKGRTSADVYEMKTGRLLRALETAPRSATLGSILGADDRTLLTLHADRGVSVWDVGSGRLRMHLQLRDTPQGGDVSPDGTRVALGFRTDSLVHLYDSDSGQSVLTLKGHSQGIFAIAFSHDGKQIVTGGGDNTVRIWDAATGTLQQTLYGHQGFINTVAFSPDGSLIASASTDESARVWDARSGALLEIFPLGRNVTEAFFRADGRTLLTQTADGTHDVWSINRDPVDPSVLRSFVRCRAPFALEGERLIPRVPTVDCTN